MKKIKVTLTEEILKLLKEDSILFNRSMNFLNNSIISYYSEQKIDINGLNMKKEVELQFFLHKKLEENYSKILNKKNYQREVDFLRDIFLAYSSVPQKEREHIVKIYDNL